MEIDFISDTDEWQTWPGYLILAFRILIMAWFLYELKEIFVLERHREKTRFYLHFGAGFLVWFVYLPILAVIGTQVSALWRHKTILSKCFEIMKSPCRQKLSVNLRLSTTLFKSAR